MLISTTVPKYTVETGASIVSLESGNILSSSSMSWDCDKYSPVKMESADTSLDDIILDQSASSDFAELKPLPYDDYGSSNGLTSNLDPVLSGHNSMLINNNNVMGNVKCLPNSPIDYMSTYSQSDVTSSASPSRTMIHKIEPLDFCKNDLDDLASIIGISIDADSTVSNGNSSDTSDIGDLNWIDNIKPLNCDINIENLMSLTHQMNSNLVLQRSNSLGNNSSIGQPQLHLVPVGTTTTTLQTILQGATNSNTTLQQMPKMTQLQQRQVQIQVQAQTQLHQQQQQQQQQQHPPPYSILQSRLQHGALAQPQTPTMVNHMVKVDSTFDLLKSQENTVGGSGYLSSSFNSPDTLPHSTQTPINQVSTSDQGLQRRLNELGGLPKIKKKQSSNSSRPKMTVLGSTSPIDHKKLMHFCQICNRGFLNKSNIKVHMRTHTGEKPFKCEHCSKAFRQKAHLLKHMSIHKRITRD